MWFVCEHKREAARDRERERQRERHTEGERLPTHSIIHSVTSSYIVSHHHT
jgi:hypothetical protein